MINSRTISRVDFYLPYAPLTKSDIRDVIESYLTHIYKPQWEEQEKALGAKLTWDDSIVSYLVRFSRPLPSASFMFPLVCIPLRVNPGLHESPLPACSSPLPPTLLRPCPLGSSISPSHPSSSLLPRLCLIGPWISQRARGIAGRSDRVRGWPGGH